jgi:hypothetical protein
MIPVTMVVFSAVIIISPTVKMRSGLGLRQG